MGSEVLALGSYCSCSELFTDFGLFAPNFKLKYEDLENMKSVRVGTVVFSLHKIKDINLFGTPGNTFTFQESKQQLRCLDNIKREKVNLVEPCTFQNYKSK